MTNLGNSHRPIPTTSSRRWRSRCALSPGRGCARTTTRAPASGDPAGCAWAPLAQDNPHSMAWAAARKKGSYLQAQFHRLRSPRDAKKAIGAVAASMLTAACHRLKDGTIYEHLGADHFDRRAKSAQASRLVSRLQALATPSRSYPCRVAVASFLSRVLVNGRDHPPTSSHDALTPRNEFVSPPFLLSACVL